MWRLLVRERADYLYILLVTVAGAYIFYSGLGSYAIRNWDEAMYATAASAVLDGHVLVPHHHWMYGPDAGFRAYLEKPPLVIWFQAVAMLAFGTTEFAVRFPSATASVLTGVLVFVIGREEFDRRAGLFGALAFYTTPMVYVGFDAGRTGGLDMTLVLFGSLFAYQTYRVATGRSDRYALLGAFAGLAVLAKGFAAGPFVFAVAPLVVYYRDRFLRPQFFRTIATTSVLVVPWTLYAWLRHGDRFLREMLYEQVFARAGGRIAVEGGVFGFQNFPYLRNQFVAFDPWIYLLLPCLVPLSLSTARRPRASRSRLFLGWWALVVLASYLPTGNHAWYLLPMYVPAVLLLGTVFSSAVEGDRTAVTATAVGLVVTAVFSVRMGPVGPQLIDGTVFEYGFAGPYVSGITYALGLAMAGALVVTASDLAGTGDWLLGPWSRRLRPVFVGLVAAVFVFSLVLVPPDTAQFDEGWSAAQKDLGADIQSAVPAGESVYFTPATVQSDNADDALHSLPFYADRHFAAATLQDMHTDESVQFAIVRERQLEQSDREYTELSRISVRDRTVVFLEFAR